MTPEIYILDCSGKISGELAAYCDSCLNITPGVFDSIEKVPEPEFGKKIIMLYVLDDSQDEVYHRNNVSLLKSGGLCDYIIVISQHTQIKTAVNFIRLGAVDYIEFNAHIYEKLGDSLMRLLNLVDLQDNLVSVNTRLVTRNRQFVASLSIILILLAVVIFVM